MSKYLYHNDKGIEILNKLYDKETPINKYQQALIKLIHNQSLTDEEKECIKVLQELVNKEVPMKVDKEHYELVDSDAGEYFIISDYYYKCPNSKCKLHKKYEICFEEKRCPECNQLLDWR